MRQSYGDGPGSEMAIVDTFTRLIFGDDTGFNSQEVRIIEALTAVQGGCPLPASDWGPCLQAMNVAEMIELVGAVRMRLEQEASLAPADISGGLLDRPHC